MNYEIRGVREGDLAYLSWNLRRADLKELYAMHGHFDPSGPLEISSRYSTETLVGVGDGKPVVVFGIRIMDQSSALIWAVGTPEVSKYHRPFLKNSKPLLRRWFQQYPQVDYMFNFTHSTNHVHHQWLRWCGAALLPETPWGKLGEPFKPFTIKREAYV